MTGSVALSLPFTPAPTALAAATACGSGGTPSVIAVGDPNFYVDTSSTPVLDSTFAGYTVRAGTTSETGLRLVLSDFDNDLITLAAGESAEQMLPTLAAGASNTQYFMMRAASITTTPQTHTISLYRGATLVCQRTFTYARVVDTIKALSNKVLTTTIGTGAATASIGDLIPLTVEGMTGTIGNGPSYDPGVISYSPTALSGFPAGAWRLERTDMTISPDGVAGQVTYTDRLYLTGTSGQDRPYTAIYWFRAIGPAGAATPAQPVQYIASGTQVKHTAISGGVTGSLPAISPVANLTLAKSANVTTFAPVSGSVRGGRVTYTVAITNVGGTTGRLDTLVDTIPSGTTFVSGSATVGGRAATPTLAGRTLTFYGPISIAAGGTTSVTYQLDIPNVVGDYVNSAVGYYAQSTIDTSANVGVSNPATTTVTVLPALAAVDAVDDSASTNAATKVTINVIANDTGTNLTVTLVSQPGNGTATVNGTSIDYTPVSGFGGADTFQYRITDGYTSDTATVTVNVPLARNDVYATQASTTKTTTTLTVATASGVLANDFCSAATCTATVVTSPSAGTLTLASNGSFTYAAPTTAGTYSFTYKLTDANGKIATATVTIYVSDFAPDRGTTPYGTAITIDVTANDSCTGTCNPTVSTSPTNGTASASGNNITYTPNSGFWGVDTYTYSKGGSGTTALVTILTGPPTANLTTTFGVALTRTPSTAGYVSGMTTASCSGCTYALGTAPTKGTVTINPASGTYTYTPADGASGSDTFTYTVTESSGLSVTGTVNVVIGPSATDDAVTVLASNAVTTNTASFNVLTNDICPTTCTVSVVTAPTSGTLTQTGTTGQFSYSNSAAIGDFTLRYRIVSSTAPTLSATANVTIHVDGAVDDTATTTSNTAVTINLATNDPCTSCTVSSVGQPTVGTVTLVGSSATYTPPSGFAGVVTFPYTVSKNGASTSARVTVTVGPAAVNDTFGVTYSTTYQLTVLDNDTCADCRISTVGTASSGTAAAGASGLDITYTSPASGAGPFTFTYTITDSTGLTATATTTLLVAVAPTVVNDSATTPAGTPVGIDLDINDTCPSGTSCTVELASDPAAGSVSVSVKGPTDVYYLPDPGYTGTVTFTYQLVSSNGLSSTGTVTVYVTPTAADDTAYAGTSQTISIAITANDVCSTCSIAVISGPSGGTVNSITTSAASYTAPATAGTYTFTYRLTETDTTPTSTAQATVTIVVSDATPDAVATPHDTAVTVNVINNDPCKSLSPACTVTSVGTSASGTITHTTTSVTFTPTTGFVGLATFTYTAANGSMTASAQVTVLVGPAALTKQTDRNTPTSGNLLTDASCSGCTVSLVSFNGVGEITIDSSGAWTYTPLDNWLGTDSTITYRITDPVTGLTTDGTLVVRVASTSPSVTVVKAAGNIVDTDLPTNGAGDAGDTVTYTYTVSNTGGDALTTVTLTDDKIASSGLSCADGTGTDNVIETLALSASVTCTGTYTLAQTDVNAGSVTNIASVVATASTGAAGAVTDTDTATVSIARSAVVSLQKAAGLVHDTDNPTNGAGDVGDTVEYTYTVTNTGNVTLYELTVTDDVIASGDIYCDDDHIITALAPGASTSCSATHALTQGNVDAGGVTNTGTVTASAPSGVTDPTPATAEVTVEVTRSAVLTVVKSGALVATGSAVTVVGDKVSYSYVISNTGNVTLSAVTLSDDKIASSGLSCADGNGTDHIIQTLAPGASVTCSGEYTVTQPDIDAGGVTNIASVLASAPASASEPALVTDDYTVDITRVVAGSLAKSAGAVVDTDAPTNSAGDPGDTIGYTYTVTNTGNATLHDLTVTDDKIVGTAIACNDGVDNDNVVASLGVGAFTTCTATYTITQDDVDAGGVTNIASLSVVGPTGTTPPDPVTDDVTVSLDRTVSFTVAKAAGAIVDTDDPTNGAGDAGDTVAYTYTVSNAGNTTISNVVLTDDRIDSTAIDCDDGENHDNVVTSLAPGASVTCTATYALQLDDVNLGSVTNIATMAASGPAGTTAVDPATDDATVSIDRTVAFTLAKVAGVVVDTDVPSNGAGDVGDTIDYTYTVTNTGNVTIYDATVTDDKIVSTGIDCGDGNVISSLVPGASVECTATYSLVVGDLETGSVTNTASLSASGPTGTSAVDPVTDDATVSIDPHPSVSIAKSATTNGTGVAGDTITYTYTVTNTGNQVLSGVAVADDKIPSGIVCEGGTAEAANTVASLGIGGSFTCTADYALSQGNVDAGGVTNVGSVAATAPGGSSGGITASDSVLVEIIRSGGVTVVKTGSVTDTDDNGMTNAGDVATYTYVVSNTGNVTLTGVTLTDDKIADADISCPADGVSDTVDDHVIAELAPNGSVTCTADYVLLQGDVDLGGVVNIATVIASSPTGADDPDPATGQYSLTIDPVRSADLVKAAGDIVDTDVQANGPGDVGDTVSYTYTITNTGNVTLSSVELTDDKFPDASAVSCGTSNVTDPLSPGDEVVCTATYSLTQADVDAGSVTNTASAQMRLADGSDVGAAVTDSAIVGIIAVPALAVVKSADRDDTIVDPSTRTDAGDTVTYTYEVTNAGNVTLYDIEVTDDKLVPAAIICADGVDDDNKVAQLLPGSSVTCVATYSVSQEVLNDGSVTNIATVTATGPAGQTTSSTSDPVTATFAPDPGLTVAKAAGDIVDTDDPTNGAGDEGDTITYTYTVENTGNVTLTDVTLHDDKIADTNLSCVDGNGTDRLIESLLPGDVVTCSGTYALTQNDVDLGGVTNEATLFATSPGGAADAVTASDTATVEVASAPSVSLAKVVDSVTDTDEPTNGSGDAGDIITYGYTITNTGNVTLTDVQLFDDRIEVGISCPADGWIDMVEDNVIVILAPGASVVCTAEYTLLQDDVDSGGVSNIGTVVATAPGGIADAVSTTDAVTAEITRTAVFSLVKAGALDDTAASMTMANDTATYTYTVSNAGNVTLYDVTLTDDLIDASAIFCDADNVIDTLAVGESVECTASYSLTQADIDAGSVTNVATVTGASPSGATAPSLVSDDYTLDITRVLSGSVVKSGALDETAASMTMANDTATYTYTVSNTGNVTLTDVTLADDLIDEAVISCDADNLDHVIAQLPPGQAVDCTASYSLSQDDVDAGAVTNVASLSVAGPQGTTSPDPATDDYTVEIERVVSASLVKLAGDILDTDDPNNGAGDLGDTVDYTYSVENTGNVRLTALTVTDDKIDSAAIACDSDNVLDLLEPGVAADCTATYTFTQDDVNAGSVTNIATLSVKGPTGTTAPADVNDSATVSIDRIAALSLMKVAGAITDTDVPANGAGDVGDTVEYTYTVTNTGNVTVYDATVTDDKIDGSAISCDGDNVIPSIVPGDSAECAGTYALTQADVDAGSVTNEASVSADGPDGASGADPVTDTATVAIEPSPSVNLTKSADPVVDTDLPANGAGDVGDTVTYTYTVTNTGNVTLAELEVTDDLIDGAAISCDADNADNVIDSLTPGAVVDCTGTYALTQADVDAGGVTNIGSVVATAPAGDPGAVQSSDSRLVEIVRSGSLAVTKSGAVVDTDDPANGAGDAGDTVTYTYTVSNTGNVTLTAVTLTDNKIVSSAIFCEADNGDNVIDSLAPGQSVTCTADYTLTQTNIEQGGVANRATVTGTAPVGATNPSIATTTYTVSIPIVRSVNIVKAAGTIVDTDSPANGAGDEGDTVTYVYTVTSTGNAIITGLALTDDKIASSAIFCDSDNVVLNVAPGAVFQCVATYTLTQADADLGSVTNIAAAQIRLRSRTATPPPPTTTWATVEIPSAPGLSVQKSAKSNNEVVGPSTRTDAGDNITYTYTVRNTGNVTLTNVEVTDDKIDSSEILCDSDNVISSLAPGVLVECTAEYTVTQTVLDGGSVSNVATVAGLDGDGTLVASTSDEVTVTFDVSASMTLSKTASPIIDTDVPADGYGDEGDVITYEYVIRNTGNATLTNLTLSDDKIDSADLLCESGNVVMSLLPGESATCSATYTITAADNAAGTVTNRATVVADGPEGVTAPEDATDSVVAEIVPAVDAIDDEASAPMGAVVVVAVLDNDLGTGLTVTGVGTPSAGTATHDGDRITVIPPLDFIGDITMPYEMSDGRTSDNATLLVHIVENSNPLVPELFVDRNGNGQRDTGEPGIAGVGVDLDVTQRVSMEFGSGAAPAHSYSTAEGSGLRSALTERLASIEVVPLASYRCSTSRTGVCTAARLPVGVFQIRVAFDPSVYGLGITADPDNDRDMTTSTMSDGAVVGALAFGLRGTAVISGTAYLESGTGSGYQSGSDVLLPNHEVTVVWAGLDGIIGTDDDVSFTVLTGSDGTFTLDGLPAGRYQMAMSAEGLPAGARVPGPVSLEVPLGGSVEAELPAVVPPPLVPGPKGRIPATGSQTGQLVLAAISLVFVGLVTTRSARRRRRA